MEGQTYVVFALQSDIIVLKIDENGDQLCKKTFASPGGDSGAKIYKNMNDYNIITGIYNDSIFKTKLDNDGNFL